MEICPDVFELEDEGNIGRRIPVAAVHYEKQGLVSGAVNEVGWVTFPGRYRLPIP